MRIMTVLCTPICENAYVIYEEGRTDCIVIDPGAYGPVSDQLKKLCIKPSAILLTHGHFDHIGGASMLRDETKAPILIHEHDAGKLTDNDSNLSVMSVPLRPLEPFEPDLLLKGDEKLSYAGFEIDVIPTPGHTSGGVCFLFREQKALFSGDTLFRESFGRYDLPDGSLRDLRESLLSTLFSLEGDFYVYPGHGDCTTLQHERERNPIRFY